MDIKNIIEAAQENLRVASKELLEQRECPVKIAGEDFSLKDYWLSLTVSLNTLMTEVTRLTVFSNKCTFPVEVFEERIKNIEALYLNILEKYYSLPKDQGQAMRNKLRLALLRLTDSLEPFFVSFLGNQGSNDEYIQVHSFVWKRCEDIKKLPQDNLVATIQHLDVSHTYITDGLDDIEEEIRAHETGLLGANGEEVDNSERWNNQERQFLNTCVILMKTARTCVQRITRAVLMHARCSTAQEILQLDDLGTAVNYLSTAVDEFVCAVFPPMNRAGVKSLAKDIVDDLRDVLLIAHESHYVTEEDQVWIRYMLKDVDHNNNKLQPLLDL